MPSWRNVVVISLFVIAHSISGQELSQRFLVVTDRTSLSALRFNPDTGALNDKFTKDIQVYAEGVAFGPDQNLYVTDALCRCIHKFNGSTGRYIEQFVRPGTTPLTIPEGLTFGPDGNLYVADIGLSAVHRYETTTGHFIDTFVKPGSGGLKNPIGLAFGPDLNLYVTSGTPTNVNPNETLSPQILKFAGDTGEFAGVFVSTRSGGLDSPFDILFGPDGYMYVSAVLIHSVLRYDAKTGAFVDVFVKPRSGGLERPTGLAFGPDGHFYVASAIGPNIGVLRYDGRSGNFKDTFISSGASGISGPTDILFYTFENRLATEADEPSVATDANGNRLVAWSQNGRISAQLFDAAGAARGGVFELTQGVNAPGESLRKPAVTATGGGYIVAWQRNLNSTDTRGLGVRTVTNGGGLGAAVQFDAPSGARDTDPAIAARAGGGAALVWGRARSADSLIFGRLLDRNGQPEGGEVQISNGALALEELPTIASDASGEMLVAWQASPASRATSSIFAVSVATTLSQTAPRAFLAPKQTPYPVDNGSPRPATEPSLAGGASGKFAIAWVSTDVLRALSEIRFVTMTGSGTTGAPSTVNADKTRSARSPSASMGSGGDTTMVWEYDSRDGGKGIYGRKFSRGVLSKFEFVVSDAANSTEEVRKASVSSSRDQITVVAAKKTTATQVVISRSQPNDPGTTKAPARRRAIKN